MNNTWKNKVIAGSLLMMGIGLFSCQTNPTGIRIEMQNDSVALLTVAHPTKYLLLPVQEKAGESQVCLTTGNPTDTPMDVRLAHEQVDYYVPFALPQASATIRIESKELQRLCLDSIRLSDSFDTANCEKYRSLYHHTPLFGWMNDANGLIYKDGEYHLFYQYNPYGSMWGNMHWGHSVSRDLVSWEHLPVALERDTLGHIFSGSSVVDFNNSAGYGEGSMISFYTSASDKNGQIQCMAYSTDNGRTFTKYEANPVLRPFDGLKDFRDPKVFWYEPEKKWVMVVSADKEMRFYSSTNLKEWSYLSGFGEGYGVQPSQFECPDFFELAVDGNPQQKKWVLIVNINPGGIFGGSATQYFVGDFDGTTFTCDTKPEVVKWLDWGKDHYATVCFSNTADRVIAVPWMSNWQYANTVPTKQFRSANALPRELTLYKEKNDIYVAANPVKEVEKLRAESIAINNFDFEEGCHIDTILPNNEGAYELNLALQSATADTYGFKLRNEAGEYVDIYIDAKAGKVYMDRTHSGQTDFSPKEFAVATWGEISKNTAHTFQVFVDKCSIELFVDGGKVAMTNLVFPETPYNLIEFHAEGGKANVKNMHIYKLKNINQAQL